MLQRLLLLRDVAAGMEFLHSKNIVHSDLVRNGAAHRCQQRGLVVLFWLCSLEGIMYETSCCC
jgi:hypothetical protein